MNMNKNNKKRKVGIKLPVYLLSLILVAAISAGVTFIFAKSNQVNLANRDTSNSQSESTQTIKDIQDVPGSQNIQAVYEIILSNYIEDVNEEDLLEGALAGMVNAIEDPYSQYLNIEETETMDETISSSFEGIGAEIMSINDQIVIVSPIKGAPADKAGLLPNDIVLSADGTSLSGMTASEAVNLIRGERGTSVSLEIQRGTQIFTVEIMRDTIPIETVSYELSKENPEIGVISVFSFARPTYDEIVTGVEALREQGAKKFVFDFRQNPGGLLDQALKIGNMFVEDGAILMQTEEKNGNPYIIKANDQEYGEFQIDEPVIMLIDEGSASASEIVAGIMKEEAEVPLVGMTTFGKGTVQSIYPLTEDSELKLTVAKWLTPAGNWIHGEGIAPDHEVELPSYAFLTIIDSTATYEVGSVSEAVKNVEEMLSAVGYSLVADGYYDYDTVEAVKQFQQDNDLSQTGEIDDQTSVGLVEELREVISENDTQLDKALELLGNMSE
ncbi:S41 family peptidase [Jeotgalibaca sp. A122]|uniref:S41 family peptidase n=1 Tax=Jeotgalibaca sp. A122 TaxID=3457322 RepID=UPI003FD57A82